MKTKQLLDAEKKDAVFQASIEFIGTLTGMKPPPIETAPPETFAPFRAFTERVCEIFADIEADIAKPVEPPFGTKRKAAMAIYTPPFVFIHGYVYDSKNNMVADHGGFGDKDTVERAVALQIRGWGRIGYMPNAQELQNEVGAMCVDALNAYYTTPQEPVPRAPYGWQVQGLRDTFKGNHAELDAKSEAARVGGTAYAFPIYIDQPAAAGWMPIETAPENQKEMFIVKAFNAKTHCGTKYTSDPWGVWSENGHFIRWPHKFKPTHWMPLPAAPGCEA